MTSNANRPENLTREELERFAWDVLDLLYGAEDDDGNFVYDRDKELGGADTVDELFNLVHRHHLNQDTGDPPPRADRRVLAGVVRNRGKPLAEARGAKFYVLDGRLYAVRPGDVHAEFLADLPQPTEAP